MLLLFSCVGLPYVALGLEIGMVLLLSSELLAEVYTLHLQGCCMRAYEKDAVNSRGDDAGGIPDSHYLARHLRSGLLGQVAASASMQPVETLICSLLRHSLYF